jgi:hypothetical protein
VWQRQIADNAREERRIPLGKGTAFVARVSAAPRGVRALAGVDLRALHGPIEAVVRGTLPRVPD